jgi:hypothetical protein
MGQQQAQQSASWAASTPLALLAATLVGALAWRHLPACLFLQTLAFTALNRVLTAQYFNWWMALLPLLAPRSRMPVGVACACALATRAASALAAFFRATHASISAAVVAPASIAALLR